MPPSRQPSRSTPSSQSGQGGKPALHRYLSPQGHERFKRELEELTRVERPKVVEVVSWAASNGDRSENADYHYGKRRLREIDRRIRFLVRKLDEAIIVDPAAQTNRGRAFFGATVRYVDENDVEATATLMGVDEADTVRGEISLLSPLARALLGTKVGDEVTVATPKGPRLLEVLAITYPPARPVG
ncbi:transcription elongation factor GreB [Formicincola oecophyllae]|uniref:Transcription elongation factor GreB n=1 Tax=Formicincola oecophyllae TaxID=2558361 RepID=A0A4Y6U8X0_9PROT|nr:transcription elongation factor GreB [Formicincola oecophyllae]QDH13913.1 transcription elongation factor GreB [Formicincola oecophyllae]